MDVRVRSPVEVCSVLRDAVIGIPRYLSYYSFAPLYETFFRELGFQVRLSPPSNTDILDAGVRETVNDACIPIKIFHGHVAAIKDRVDFLFVPRLAGAKMHYTVCPKFLGLPDMVRGSISDLPDIIAPRLPMGRDGLQGLRSLYRTGVRLTGRRVQAMRALHNARRALGRRINQIQQGGLEALGFDQPRDADLTVALIGYPYMLYDTLASGGILGQLRALGVRVVTPEMVSTREMRRHARAYPENLFWYYSNRSLWAGMHYMTSGLADGIIHVTAFGCGPDAMVNKLLELESARYGAPFMAITVDEHTGDVGLRTRVEAFVDMLRWQAARKEGLT